MKANIKAISYYLPEKILTNEDLSKEFPKLSAEDIFKRTGIRKRHISPDLVFGSDLAFFAAEKLFIEHNLDKSKIDFLIFCTEGLDYKGPTTACTLQHRLSLPISSGALDLPYGCTGFIYCLCVAKTLIESGQASSVLVLNSDTPSKVMHPSDVDVRMIFGDAGAAILVKSQELESGIGNFVFGTDGSGSENLIVKRSGVRDVIDSEWLKEHEQIGGMKFGRLEMKSLEVFSFTLRVVPPLLEDVLKKNNLEMKEIDLFIFHQANAFLLNLLRRKLKIEEERFFLYMEEVGNTVCATIPIALYEAIKIGKAKKGDRILLASFGIGFSWAGTVITL